MARTRMIVGTKYTQADSWTRDQKADMAAALAQPKGSELMYLHGLGYDCSQARVVEVAR
jgi:hypothetical protein